uniref:Uncharacterized protein n=1 Tax=Strigamia maritima TaxID=126957 RepID=T1JKG4_STRMM
KSLERNFLGLHQLDFTCTRRCNKEIKDAADKVKMNFQFEKFLEY